MKLRESHTAILSLGEDWNGKVATEPYEAAWASEALFFLRSLGVEGAVNGARAAVQISPDGVHWVDEGTTLALPGQAGELTFCRVLHFGTYLRLRAELPAGAVCRLVATLSLKA